MIAAGIGIGLEFIRSLGGAGGDARLRMAWSNGQIMMWSSGEIMEWSNN